MPPRRVGPNPERRRRRHLRARDPAETTTRRTRPYSGRTKTTSNEYIYRIYYNTTISWRTPELHCINYCTYSLTSIVPPIRREPVIVFVAIIYKTRENETDGLR